MEPNFQNVVGTYLLNHVELPVFSRIVSDSGRIVPIAVVGADVVIEQHRLEPLRSEPPIEIQIFDEKACHVLATSVGHPTGSEKFPHIRVHERNAGLATSPFFKRRFVLKCYRIILIVFD